MPALHEIVSSLAQIIRQAADEDNGQILLSDFLVAPDQITLVMAYQERSDVPKASAVFRGIDNKIISKVKSSKDDGFGYAWGYFYITPARMLTEAETVQVTDIFDAAWAKAHDIKEVDMG